MTTTTPTPLSCPDNYLAAAIQGELRLLGSLPDENINKPHSVFFACLLRLASVGKAAGIPPGHFVPHIWAAVQTAPRRHRLPAKYLADGWVLGEEYGWSYAEHPSYGKTSTVFLRGNRPDISMDRLVRAMQAMIPAATGLELTKITNQLVVINEATSMAQS